MTRSIISGLTRIPVDITSATHIDIYLEITTPRPHQNAGGAGGEESHPQHPGGDQEGPRQGEGAPGGPQHPEAASTNCKYISTNALLLFAIVFHLVRGKFSARIEGIYHGKL